MEAQSGPKMEAQSGPKMEAHSGPKMEARSGPKLEPKNCPKKFSQNGSPKTFQNRFSQNGSPKTFQKSFPKMEAQKLQKKFQMSALMRPHHGVSFPKQLAVLCLWIEFLYQQHTYSHMNLEVNSYLHK